MDKIKRRIKKEKRRKIKTIFITAMILLCSCSSKIVYLGEKEAIFYKGAFEQCHHDRLECEKDLDTCSKVCDELGL